MKTMRVFSVVLLFVCVTFGQTSENEQVSPRRVQGKLSPRQAKPAPKNCTCGVIQTSNEDRIVNGNETQANKYPWDVALYMSPLTSNYTFFCGGAIISENWILTAAHCVDGYRSLSFPWNPLIVVAGANDLRKEENSTRQYRAVYTFNMHIHPKYSTLTHIFDIALLELRTPLSMTKAVSPGCLPYQYRNMTFEKEKVTAHGWGVTGETNRNSSARENMEVTLDVISNKKCQELYNKNSSGTVQIRDEMMCTYTYNNKTGGSDTCQGDSGGTIDWTNPWNGLAYLVGIVSFGEGCARENRPGAYARMTKVMDFIDRKTKNQICKK